MSKQLLKPMAFRASEWFPVNRGSSGISAHITRHQQGLSASLEQPDPAATQAVIDVQKAVNNTIQMVLQSTKPACKALPAAQQYDKQQLPSVFKSLLQGLDNLKVPAYYEVIVNPDPNSSQHGAPEGTLRCPLARLTADQHQLEEVQPGESLYCSDPNELPFRMHGKFGIRQHFEQKHANPRMLGSTFIVPSHWLALSLIKNAIVTTEIIIMSGYFPPKDSTGDSLLRADQEEQFTKMFGQRLGFDQRLPPQHIDGQGTAAGGALLGSFPNFTVPPAHSESFPELLLGNDFGVSGFEPPPSSSFYGNSHQIHPTQMPGYPLQGIGYPRHEIANPGTFEGALGSAHSTTGGGFQYPYVSIVPAITQNPQQSAFNHFDQFRGTQVPTLIQPGLQQPMLNSQMLLPQQTHSPRNIRRGVSADWRSRSPIQTLTVPASVRGRRSRSSVDINQATVERALQHYRNQGTPQSQHESSGTSGGNSNDWFREFEQGNGGTSQNNEIGHSRFTHSRRNRHAAARRQQEESCLNLSDAELD
ncbi:hypothetical protein T439DRAFT_352408 [Meredithblackwellia eburnea MCA 4105]